MFPDCVRYEGGGPSSVVVVPTPSPGASMASGIKLFGEAAFEKGYITTAQLYEALSVQAKMEADGSRRKFLGEILIELGFMSDKQVLEILNELHDVNRDLVQ